MLEKISAPFKSGVDFMRLYIFIPETLSLLAIVAVLYQKRDWLSANLLPVKDSPQFWGVVTSALATQSVNAFFSRLRENRDYAISENKNTSIKNWEDIDIFLSMGEESFKQANYFKAEQYFQSAKESVKKVYSDLSRTSVKTKLQQICYRQAECLFKAAKFDKALQLIENELSKDNAFEAITLKGIIYFKLCEYQSAKECFDSSLKINSNQNVAYLFQQFLNKNWDKVISHIPYFSDVIAGIGSDPFPVDISASPELAIIFGEACFRKGFCKQAIAMFDAGIRAIPKTIIHLNDRALLHGYYAKALHKLFENNSRDTQIILLNGDTITFKPEDAKIKLEKSENAFKEARDFSPEDKRNGTIESEIRNIGNFINGNQDDNKIICKM